MGDFDAAREEKCQVVKRCNKRMLPHTVSAGIAVPASIRCGLLAGGRPSFGRHTNDEHATQAHYAPL